MTYGSKEKPANHPFSLCHFLFFSQTFYFLFYMLLFLPCFSFPQSSEVITVLWSCVMEPAVINLMNSAQSPPFIVPSLKCKLHCVYVEFGCTFVQYKPRIHPDYVHVFMGNVICGFLEQFSNQQKYFLTSGDIPYGFLLDSSDTMIYVQQGWVIYIGLYQFPKDCVIGLIFLFFLV